ncbi:MAG TPA: AAA family ATPase [Leptospiraceae bacterium]|nr:AAA family ATPase [Leptospiraceae bacterium]HNF13197.1 AAA family ATPase [Leptospiraceae bacterium]HNF24608.1 AAA family ATPase [Leptospiraceae bacterium]HNI27133.1 AAA family ATPase [Leptospiraceae bacterium]HNI95321.1 AAA family ATPase [Leptospiraceae bacterium]
MNETKNTLDFLQLKELIFRETKDSKGENSVRGLSVTSEKGEIKIEFTPAVLTKEMIFDSIKVIKTQIENLRVHTFENNYYSFQALNENIFETKGILDNIRFRFFTLGSSNRIEVSRKGNFREEESLAVLNLLKFFSESETKTVNPKEILSRLGIEVFDPLEAEIKGEAWDFGHMAGYEITKREVQDSIIWPILHPDAFTEITLMTRKYPGKNRPRAVLFEGDPGVGKTTMAKIVSCLCRIPMIYVPIESILSKYYGESSQNLALVFDAAELFPASLLFLDEIDSLAGRREDGMFEATRKLLSVLLRKLDGFEGKPNTVTIGATNRKQDLDSALVSRFDKSILFPLPDGRERTAILGNYAVHLSEDERNRISSKMEGLSGRKIRDFCDFTERRWVSLLLESGKKIEPPPAEIYLEAMEIYRR